MGEYVKFVDNTLYSEADQAEVQNRLRAQGVLAEVTSQLQPSASGATPMTVSIAQGEAMIQGFHYKNDGILGFPMGANSSGSTRTDTIVLRLNRTLNTLQGVVVTGTPGAGAPALTQIAGGTWEFPLVDVAIPTGTTTITSAMLTDRRVWSKALVSSDEVSTATAMTSQLQQVRRELTVDPATKLLYFAEPIAKNKNWLHNSSARVNQRANGNVLTHGAYPCDRWSFTYNPGSGAYLAYANVSTTTPGSVMAGTHGTATASLAIVKSDNNALTSSSLLGLVQNIEGTDLRNMSNADMVLSFFAYATKAGTYGYTIEQVGGNLRYNGTFTVAANTWTWVWAYIPWSNLSGSWPFTTAAGMAVRFIAIAGSGYQGTSANAWNTQGQYAPNTISNALTASGDTLFINSPKLEIGTRVPTPYEAPNITQEELECYRYLYIDKSLRTFFLHNIGQFMMPTVFPTPMRAVPSFTNVGVTSVAATTPGAAQLAFLINNAYMTNITMTTWTMYNSGVAQCITMLNSSTTPAGASAGMAGQVYQGSSSQPTFSAEI